MTEILHVFRQVALCSILSANVPVMLSRTNLLLLYPAQNNIKRASHCVKCAVTMETTLLPCQFARPNPPSPLTTTSTSISTPTLTLTHTRQTSTTSIDQPEPEFSPIPRDLTGTQTPGTSIIADCLGFWAGLGSVWAFAGQEETNIKIALMNIA